MLDAFGVKAEPGVEHIQSGSELWAIILSCRYREEGIGFFTPHEFSPQLAFMRHPAGKLIAPQFHNPVLRDEKGQFKHHWRRWLTENIGHPEPEMHLHPLNILERANRSCVRVDRPMQRAFSTLNDPIELNLAVKDGEPL